MDFGELKLKEISLIIELSKTGSLRELARHQGFRPGQLSKWVSGAETKIGFRVFDRSTYGLTLTPEGREVLPLLEQLQQAYANLESLPVSAPVLDEMTFATNSFFSTHLLPSLFADITKGGAPTRFRLIDLPPTQMLSVAMRGGFQCAVHMGGMDWPGTWTSRFVGDLHWHLYCRSGHPTEGSQQLTQILKYPFVSPVYWTKEGIKFGDDQCPLPMNKRKKGDLTATASSALEIVLRSDQFAFLPEIVARPYVERGDLLQKDVRSWRKVSAKVYLTVKSDQISQKLFKKMQEQLHFHLSE